MRPSWFGGPLIGASGSRRMGRLREGVDAVKIRPRVVVPIKLPARRRLLAAINLAFWLLIFLGCVWIFVALI